MKNIFVISSDFDIVEGPFPSAERAFKRRDYLNSYLTQKEYADHKYIVIVCDLDEYGDACLTNFDELGENIHG